MKKDDVCLLSKEHVPLIVYSNNRKSRCKEAAVLLQTTLEDITGIFVKAVCEDRIKECPEKFTVLVGPSRFTTRLGISVQTLPPQTLQIKSTHDRLVLIGALPGEDVLQMAQEADLKKRLIMLENEAADGTYYAVVYFLKKFLDVDWLFPGAAGYCFLRKDAVCIPSGIDMTYTPGLIFRRIRNNFSGRDRNAEGLAKMGVNPRRVWDREPVSREWFSKHFLGFASALQFTHNFGYLWPSYKEKHPEWFALQENGTRDQSLDPPDRSRLCVSNEELIEHIANGIKEYFRNNPWAKCYSISPNDGGCNNKFCICDKCRALDPPDAPVVTYGVEQRKMKSLTDRMFIFFSRIAAKVEEEFPDKLLGTYAYSVYRTPPVSIKKVPDNLVVGLVTLEYENESLRQKGREEINAWSKICKHLFVRPNALWAYRGFPAFYARRLAADVRYSMGKGCIGFDWDCNAGNWSPSGANIWILARVMWEHELEVDELVDKWCKLGFGDVWEPVKQYLLNCEKLNEDFAKKGVWTSWLVSIPDLAACYTDTWLEKNDALLLDAKRRTKDMNVQSRLDFLRLALKVTRIRRDYFLSVTNEEVDREGMRGMETEHLDGMAVKVFKGKDAEVCKKRLKLYREIVDSFAFNIGSLNWRNL